ncbi:Glucanosyltransferase-domain-containing protein [Amylocystis lapponica]|nr:Glucanosyltransferase-domain-containing protein [Amylocystis lapponica]
MRGEFCVGSATVLSLTALLCLIFMHVGQINTSSVPRDISMFKVNMSNYGAGLEGALGDPIEGLYTANASAPLQERAGLRQMYKFGLYSYCAYVNTTHGICSSTSGAKRFQPYNEITADMLANYSSYSDALITNTTFTDSSYLGEFSNGAYYLIIIGSVSTALALLAGILKHPLAFVSSTIFAAFGSLMLLIGAIIWTVVIRKAESVNGILVGTASNPVPLGITVSTGNALYLLWAAWVCLLASVLPYMIRLVAAVAAALALTTAVHAIQTVTRQGRYLYTADGSRFFIKGVAYQEQGEVTASSSNPFGEPSTFIDPLANSTACARDIPYLQKLAVNTVRVYSVSSSLDHDDCMNALSNAGIYTIIDLSLPLNGSIDRDAPSWTTALLDQYITTIEAFNKYDNVLAYNVGNEVVTQANETATAAFIKGAARDIKAYLTSVKSTALVGYASIDAPSNWKDPFANYMSCDPSNSNSGATAIDLYGLNNYEWCSNSPPDTYNATNADFAGYNIPAYFSEYGCNNPAPRDWSEVPVLFSEPMSDIWSGGVAFSYFPAESAQGEFGMVTFASNGSVVPSTDFTSLEQQYSSLSVPNSPGQSSAGTTQYPSCPSQNSTWLASATLPPTPNDAACNCIESALSCQFTPKQSNTSVIVGDLLDYTCSLLGQQGGSCNAISANGSSGVYGLVSPCAPSIELSYIMSQYYELTSNNAQSCNFAGNATVNKAAATVSASAAASSCDSNPSATFVPSAPASSGGSSGSSGSSGSPNAASSVSSSSQALLGLGVACALSVVGGLFTLA